MFIRRLPEFEYHAPATAAEALDLLTKYKGKAAVFAGGTDLLPAMKRRERRLEHLVNLKNIAALRGVSPEEGEGIRIGALTTLGELERSAVIRRHLPMLWQAVQVMASPQIRTLATVGGNLCSALPSADTAPPLLALKASVRLLGPGGERNVPLGDFFKGPGLSILREDEILADIFIPRPPELSGGVYLKLMRRRAMELALVGVAVYMTLDGPGGKCEEAGIALGAVAPTPIRVPEAEAVLFKREISEVRASEAGAAASRSCNPRKDSIRASVEYRLSMVQVLTKRAVLEAYWNIIRDGRIDGRERTG